MPVLIRIAVCLLLLGIPGARVIALQLELRRHCLDGSAPGPVPWNQVLREYHADRYTPQGRAVLKRLEGWRVAQVAATFLALAVFAVWELVDPILTVTTP